MHFLYLLLLLIQTSGHPPKADLLIQDATVFLQDGNLAAGMSIIINADTITAILPATASVSAIQTINANGRLVTPGFVAIDEHLDDVFGDSIGRLTMQADSFVAYRQHLTETYLPFGVTTVRTSGDAEEWLPMALEWMRHPNPNAPDFFTSGGQFITPYGGRKYVNHVFAADSLAAIRKVAEYAEMGITNIKLYGNLQYAGFVPAFAEAQRRGMHVSAQVQWATGFDSTLAIGLRNFEQVATLFYEQSVLDFWGDRKFQAVIEKYWGDGHGNQPIAGSRIYPYLEAARYIGKDNPKVLRLVRKMKEKGAGMVPCLHFFAQWLGKTWFCSTPKAARFDVSAWTPLQFKHAREGYKILAHTTYQMYKMGIPLRIGTDHKDGGKAVLSEMLLLHEAGIPMQDVFQIATRNGAEAIGQLHRVGTIVVGKQANLIVFDQNPLKDAQNLLGKKTVIKGGVEFNVEGKN
jgi:imidazolonepropionase-like amidohydrolase